MDHLLLKRTGAVALGIVNLALLVWALAAHRRKQPLPNGYYTLQAVSVLLAGVQVGAGVTLVLQGLTVTGRHLFYGIVVGAAALGQVGLGRRMALGQRYRGRPLVFAFAALVVLLAAVRSWLTA